MMAEGEPSQPVFRLASIRLALTEAAQAAAITSLVDAVEQIPEAHPGLVFDLCRALIETICKTILADLGEPVPPNPNAENMVSLVLKRLEVFADPQFAEATSKRAVGDTVTGINKFVNGIGEYRRLFGTASHGRDGYSEAIDRSHAYLVAGVTDALATFLLTTHRRLRGDEEWQRAFYGEHPDFDQYLNDEHDPSPILVFGDPFPPSQVFHAVNQAGYVKRLNDWRKLKASGEIESEEPST